ncbi:hypothetical protein PMAYCL1PPCAC_22155, partial [Pristionchus mayeri]
RVPMLLICIISVAVSAPYRETGEDTRSTLEKSIQVLRNAVTVLEGGYMILYGEDAPIVDYADKTTFHTELVNVVYHQVARNEPGYIDNGNPQEKTLVKIAKYL